MPPTVDTWFHFGFPFGLCASPPTFHDQNNLLNFNYPSCNLVVWTFFRMFRSLSWRADKIAVAATTTSWTHTVALGTYDAPRKTADLYAKDAILWGTEVCGPDDDLWGTVSETVRDTPEQIYAYFVSIFSDDVTLCCFRVLDFVCCSSFLLGGGEGWQSALPPLRSA